MTVFENLCVEMGLQAPVAEFQFAQPRKWRFDWCWPEAMLALEIEGGVWKEGRHNRASGFLADMEKYNAAACLGWRIVRCTPKDMEKGNVFVLLKEAMP